LSLISYVDAFEFQWIFRFLDRFLSLYLGEVVKRENSFGNQYEGNKGLWLGELLGIALRPKDRIRKNGMSP